MQSQSDQATGGSFSVEAFWSMQQRALSRVLHEIVPEGSRVLYLDYPVVSNVGDLLIFVGTERWLQRSSLDIQARCSLYDYRFPQLDPKVILLCHGGGNFGDLYKHQAFREKLVTHYPRNRIVFLPQTVYYRDPAALRESAQRLNAHNDLHLLLRDRRSLELARRHFPACDSYLTPDMAAMLYPLSVPPVGGKPLAQLCLWRTDIETPDHLPLERGQCDWTGDWRSLLGYRYLPMRLVQVSLMLFPRLIPAATAAAVWKMTAEYATRHCAAAMSRATFVKTSRLHGHILAALLGIPNRLYDNSYGKNSAYYECWHADNPRTEMETADDASTSDPETARS